MICMRVRLTVTLYERYGIYSCRYFTASNSCCNDLQRLSEVCTDDAATAGGGYGPVGVYRICVYSLCSTRGFRNVINLSSTIAESGLKTHNEGLWMPEKPHRLHVGGLFVVQ